jgi:hypothetical protein
MSKSVLERAWDSTRCYVYVRNLTGLAGKTELDQLRADMLVDCCEDITNPIYAFMFHEPDPARKVM